MKALLRHSIAALFLLTAGGQAQQIQQPLQQTDIAACLSLSSDALTVEYGGKTYRLRDEACRQLFQTDPERYAQLFDALLEENNGAPPKPKIKPQDSASLVPS